MKLPQLSLRELLLLVVIAAMGCGWWVDRSMLKAAASIVYEAIEMYELEDVPFGSAGPRSIETPFGRYRITISAER